MGQYKHRKNFSVEDKHEVVGKSTFKMVLQNSCWDFYHIPCFYNIFITYELSNIKLKDLYSYNFVSNEFMNLIHFKG